MEEKEENKHIFHPDTHELKKAEPPTLMQYLRSLRDNQFREDERNRIFGQGPIIRDPRTNEAYTNPLLLLGDTMDTVNDQITLKNISPMLKFLPEDNTSDKLKNIANYSLKDFQYDAMDFVGEKARENIDTGLPILDKALIGGAVLGTALAVPDATDVFIPGASDALKASRKINWNQLATKLDDWLNPYKYSLFNIGSRNFAVSGGGEIPTTMMKTTSLGGGGTQFVHSVYSRSNAGLLKQLKQQGVLDQAEEILKNLDAFKNTEGKIQKYAKWNPHRPTTGFKGVRTVKYTNSSGVPSEVAFRWSASEKTYVPYDLVRRQNTILKRMRWNVNRSPTAKKYADKVYKKAKSDNALFTKLLKELRKNDPQKYFDIMGDTRTYATNKGFIYVEHIHPQNSPWWKYMTKDKFKPRDTQNLMIAKEEFGKLKTSIENEIYNNKNFEFPDGKRLLLDYDRKEEKLVLKQLQDNGRLKWIGDISAITNPRDWRKALDAALRGHVIEPGKLGEIQQVIQAETDIPRHVDIIDRITDWKKNPYE